MNDTDHCVRLLCVWLTFSYRTSILCMKKSDILSIAVSSMSISNWSQEQRRGSRSCSTPNPRHGQHVPRHDGRHFGSGETFSNRHTEAQTDSSSRARQRGHSSTSSSSSSDSSSSTSSFISKASSSQNQRPEVTTVKTNVDLM